MKQSVTDRPRGKMSKVQLASLPSHSVESVLIVSTARGGASPHLPFVRTTEEGRGVIMNAEANAIGSTFRMEDRLDRDYISSRII